MSVIEVWDMLNNESSTMFEVWNRIKDDELLPIHIERTSKLDFTSTIFEILRDFCRLFC